MRVVFASKIARKPIIDHLKKVEGIDLMVLDELSEMPPLVKDADVLVIQDPRGADGRNIAQELKQPGCKVRWVQIVSAGFEGLTAHNPPAHIQITNQGGAVAPVVAEHAMASILAMARQIPAIVKNSARRAWEKDFAVPVMSVERKTLVIVGHGNIGRHLAKRAKAFDMRVLAVSRSKIDDPNVDEAFNIADMHKALAQADAVAVCIALSASTRGVFGAKEFAACKKGALFTNVSRGETVDQAALKAALESGQIGFAFIDVTTPEPLPSDDSLWSAPNIVIGPHTAGGGSLHTGDRVGSTVADNLRRFIAGQPLQHLIKI
jgi:phosphoglycerate dehydrogenase-like enzyme